MGLEAVTKENKEEEKIVEPTVEKTTKYVPKIPEQRAKDKVS